MSNPQRDHAAVRFPPPLVFVAFTLLGLGMDRWLWRLPSFGPVLDGMFEVLGAVLAGIALVILALCLVRFRRDGQRPEPWTPTPALIDDGLYAMSRNPMYLAMALLQAGIGLVLGSPWVLLLLGPSLWCVDHLAVRAEERYLESVFGAAYRDYCARVGRWL